MTQKEDGSLGGPAVVRNPEEVGAGMMAVWGGGLVFLLHWARALPHSPVASAKEENSDPEENGLWARGPHRLACPLLG